MKSIKTISDRLPKHKVVLDPRSYRMAHPVYSTSDIEDVQYTHMKPLNMRDRLAGAWVSSIRWVFDKATGYSEHNMP